MSRPSDHARISRRRALRAGGLSISIAAIAAACGDDREGDDAPGRVGNAPPVTDLPDYPITDTVFLRTASSLEYTAVELYEQAKGLGLGGSTIDRLIQNHEGLGESFGALTEAAGGTAWTCINPWYVERVVGPVVAAISAWDDESEVIADLSELAVSFESLASASHQQFVSQVGDPALRLPHAEAAALEARHASWLAISLGGSDSYIAPAMLGEDNVRDERGGIPQYAITHTFGSLAPIEVVAGPPDENGVRASFNLTTPAENSYVYDELTCSA